MNEEEILRLMDSITNAYLGDLNINSVTFNEEKSQYEVSVIKIKKNWKITSVVDNDGNSYEIVYKEGPEIIQLIGDFAKDPPAKIKNDNRIIGGMMCALDSMKGYGTVTYSHGWSQFDVTRRSNGRVIYTCKASPSIVTNEHVIPGAKGGKIWCNTRNNIVGNKECGVDLRDSRDVHFDYALGKVKDRSLVSAGLILEIGQSDYANKVKAKKGIRIQKYGARTGLTRGKCGYYTNIYVNGRPFYHVWSTSKGFSCAGDSGSLVMDMNKRPMGVISWGQKKSCSSNPIGYFWAVHHDSQKLSSKSELKNGDII